MSKNKAKDRAQGAPKKKTKKKKPEFRYLLDENDVLAISTREDRLTIYHTRHKEICRIGQASPEIRRNHPDHDNYHSDEAKEQDVDHSHEKFQRTPSELDKNLNSLANCDDFHRPTKKLLSNTTTTLIVREFSKFRGQVKSGTLENNDLYEGSNIGNYRLSHTGHLPTIHQHEFCLYKAGARCEFDSVNRSWTPFLPEKTSSHTSSPYLAEAGTLALLGITTMLFYKFCIRKTAIKGRTDSIVANHP